MDILNWNLVILFFDRWAVVCTSNFCIIIRRICQRKLFLKYFSRRKQRSKSCKEVYFKFSYQIILNFLSSSEKLIWPRIGIRSEDIKDFMEKILGGTIFALSSPRLVIPGAIFGLWALSRHFPNDYFDFQVLHTISLMNLWQNK